MLFNSIDFVIFLPLVFLVYWLALRKNLKVQNGFLVLASYVFYGWWDWRFLSLIIFSSLVDYLVGIWLSKTKIKSKRKWILSLSIIVNLGFLGFFKYFNFFSQSFADAFTLFGQSFEASRLDIILPVGISFYTFQTLSYSIDVYRKKLKPTRDVISFLAFVSFFPQLVAGPIERANNLLPQFYIKRSFSYEKGVNGLSLILWGLFKKVVIADNCALIVNQIFNDYSQYSGSTLLFGGVLFAFQIYGDFSGYSDMAIGTARLFGFNLKRNFAYPYFSRDIAEFWRRWHISLSSWFKDYLYIPLGGSRGGVWMAARNTIIVFLVSGFWHGANWTFIFWGLLNAIYFLPLLFFNRNRRNMDIVASERRLPSFRDFFSMTGTFILVVFGWIFFRASDISEAIDYISIIFSETIVATPYVFGVGMSKAAITLSFVAIMIVIEWMGRRRENPIYLGITKSAWKQWTICYALVIAVFLFGQKQQDFIYFQF